MDYIGKDEPYNSSTMRPPASDRMTVGSVSAHDVTSGISLKGFSEWRNLTANESIQIANIDDISVAEASFYLNRGHTNSLKFVETIVSPTCDIMTSDNGANDIAYEQKPEGVNRKRTLVCVDKLATRSGRLLDSRLIFSPCAGENKRLKARRTLDDAARRQIDTQRSSPHQKLWHSDSELFAPLEESMLAESSSLSAIYDKQFRLHGALTLPSPEQLSLVKPLKTITHTPKVGEIKPVSLLCTYDANVKEAGNKKPEVVKTQTAVTKVCNTISKSIRKKRKSITNIGRLHELFKAKLTSPEVNRTVESSDNTADTLHTVSKMASANCAYFESDNKFVAQQLNESNDDQLAIVHRNDKTGSVCRRVPCLGVRGQQYNTVKIDTLHMELVCDLKRSLRQNQIKTNGSLKQQPKASPFTAERMHHCSPKRVGSRRLGTNTYRTNRTCIVSTV